MKRFIKKFIILSITISIIVMLVNEVYLNFRTNDNVFETMPEKVQICNFGSSHGLFGFDYEDYKEQYACFNFALVSQSLSYDYRLFQNYESHIDDETIVFITISYFSFYGKKEELAEDFESKNKRYYNILPARLIKKYDFKTDIFLRYIPSLSADSIELLGTLLIPIVGKKEDNNITEVMPIATANSIDVKEDARLASIRHINNEDKYDSEGRLLENKEEIQSLRCLIKDCKEKGAIPILITTPYLKEYTDEIKKVPGFYESFYSIIEQISREEGVEYYDYAFDERFFNQYDLFMNSDHLNENGAKMFVDIIMKEIVYKNNYL